ncbi:MAG: mechanosensitive ion channel family protein [Methanosarcinaceae archaeon]|nr:mechanosensitive ion channel family protein [Methanosarcinaceae archaeon]
MANPSTNPAETLLSVFSSEVVLQIVLLVLSSYLFVKIIIFIILHFSERFESQRVKIRMFAPVVKIMVYLIVLYLIAAYILELSAEQLLAFSAVAGAIIGFGLKDLFSDIAGGIVIVLESTFHLGDQIRMGDYYGEVIDIGLRSTRLKTPDDNIVSVPNSLIFTESVASGNYGNSEMMIVTDMFIDPKSDAYLAMKIIKEAALTSKYIFLDENHKVTVLLNEFPSHLRLFVKAYVNDLRYEFKFRSDITLRSWNAFHEHGIEAPEAFFPGYYQSKDSD